MSGRALRLAALLLVATPAGAAAQCGIDLVEAGIQAYRDLELAQAKELLYSAIAVNGRASSPCATQNARALTYLGASHWLLQEPDSAVQAFEEAVIQAPRFRPDAVEFPPDITEAFDRVRAGTPAVAVAMPDEVDIETSRGETLWARLTASTSHWVTVTVQGPERAIRTLYRGPIVIGAQGTLVEWDGRDQSGEVVGSGPYDIEIVSSDSLSQPLRKVIVALNVSSDAAPPPAPDTALQALAARDDGVWDAVGAGVAGLVGATAVIVAPRVVDGFPETSARYAVAASLGVAGIVGFVQRLGRAQDVAEARREVARPSAEPPDPTLSIRAGWETRVEIPEARRTSGPEREWVLGRSW